MMPFSKSESTGCHRWARFDSRNFLWLIELGYVCRHSRSSDCRQRKRGSPSLYMRNMSSPYWSGSICGCMCRDWCKAAWPNKQRNQYSNIPRQEEDRGTPSHRCSLTSSCRCIYSSRYYICSQSWARRGCTGCSHYVDIGNSSYLLRRHRLWPHWRSLGPLRVS